MSDNIEDSESPLILTIVVLCPMLFATYIYAIFCGASNISKWIIGGIFLVIIILVYRKFRTKYHNVGIFLIFVYLSLWVLPTWQFILYESNPKNYNASESFLNNEASLAQEKSKGKLTASDLTRIISKLTSVTSYIKIEEGNRSPPMAFINIDSIHTIYIPEPIKFTCKKLFSVSARERFEIKFAKGDSLVTTLQINTDFGPSSNGVVISALNDERKEQLLLEGLKNRKARIPYSEFLIESITTFSSSDITPARNLPKVLNGLQALLIILITTIIINTTGNGLTIKRKEGKKGIFEGRTKFKK